MNLALSAISFFLPFILIPLLPKSLPETAYAIAVYLIILPAGLLIAKYLILNTKYLILLRRLLIIFIILYGLYLFAMSLARYYNFRSEIIDLSYYDHVLYQLSQFKIPKVWDVPQWFVWGDHFDAILFLFVPLYWLKREPAFLMALQSGLAILTTIPIYLYAKLRFKNLDLNKNLKLKIKNSCEKPNIIMLALSISFAYLLFSPHQMGYLYGFHEIVMFPFFFFWMLYFLETKKTKLFLLFLFLTTIIKEETFMYLIFLGIYYLFKNFLIRKKLSIINYQLSIIFIVTGLLWYLFTFHLIFPNFYPHWDIHRGLYSDISRNLLAPYKIGTIINHFAPFGFLSLLYPPSLIITIPAWGQKLLTNDIASLSGFHYSSAITALIIFASIEALSHSLRKNYLRNLSYVSYFVIFSAFYSNFFLGYSPSSLKNLSLKEFQKTPGQDAAYDFMKEIPSEASVSASYILVPHLKKPFGKIFAVPRNNEDSEYILLNHNISIPLTTASLYKQYLAGLEKNYQILKSQNNVFLLKSTLDKQLNTSP